MIDKNSRPHGKSHDSVGFTWGFIPRPDDSMYAWNQEWFRFMVDDNGDVTVIQRNGDDNPVIRIPKDAFEALMGLWRDGAEKFGFP